MNMKEKVLKMPVWKAAVCVLVFLFAIGTIFETVLVHSVFHFFDRIIFKMEIQKKEDLTSLDDTAQHEQNGFCEKYKEIEMRKSFLGKRDASNSFDYKMLDDDEDQIKFGLQHHQFNLAKCQRFLKRKVT
jgi:hypothetical protein